MLSHVHSMLSHEELAYQKVARLVVYTFYDNEETLVMEMLLTAPRRMGSPDEKTGAVVHHPTMQLDEYVAERLSLGTKQVRKHLRSLEEDRLVFKTRGGTDKDAKKKSPAYDPKAVEGLASGELNASDVRYFWGINYEVLVDAVHFKLDAMKRALDNKHNQANAEPQCHWLAEDGQFSESLATPTSASWDWHDWLWAVLYTLFEISRCFRRHLQQRACANARAVVPLGAGSLRPRTASEAVHLLGSALQPSPRGRPRGAVAALPRRLHLVTEPTCNTTAFARPGTAARAARRW